MGKACSCETLDIEIELEPKPQREEITNEKYTNEIQEKLQFVEKVIASGELFTDSDRRDLTYRTTRCQNSQHMAVTHQICLDSSVPRFFGAVEFSLVSLL